MPVNCRNEFAAVRRRALWAAVTNQRAAVGLAAATGTAEVAAAV